MATKLRGSSLPTMEEHADDIHPPPPTTRNNATPNLRDAQEVQRNIMQDGKPPKFTGKGTTGGISIGNPFTAADTIIKNIRRR